MSKFCVKCGAELPEKALFCKKCGAKIGEIEADESKKEELNQKSPISENKQKKEKLINLEAIDKNHITIIIVATMILITIIVIVSIIVSGKKTEKKIMDSIETKNQSVLDDNEVEDIIEDSNIEEKYKAVDEKESKSQGNEENSTPEQTVPEDENSSTPNDTNNEGEAKKMTDDEFTLCWYQDQYLDKIPLIGYGTYETIVQSEKYTVAIVSNISKEQVKLYCEHTGSEGDLDLNGFTENAKRVADSENEYAFQVSNKDGVTVYVAWSDNVAVFTVGIE